MFETDSTDFRAISNDIKCHVVPCRASPMAVAAVRPVSPGLTPMGLS